MAVSQTVHFTNKRVQHSNSVFDGEVTRATHVTVITVVCYLLSTVEQHGLVVLSVLCVGLM